MKRIQKLILLSLSLLLVVSLFPTIALAGERMAFSSFVDAEKNINETEWYKSDENIVYQNEKLVIPADTSNADTKFISKLYASPNKDVKEMVSVSAKLKLTALPKGEKFIFGFGLQGIEAAQGDSGNVEMAFVNNGGLQVSVISYGDEEKTLMNNRSCGISINQDFDLEANITSNSVLTLKINGNVIFNGTMPSSGEGRFGIIQTGSCGAEFSTLVLKCNYYDRPENTNIYEDFEDGEFNINELVSFHSLVSQGSSTIGEMNLRIEEYNGSNVLMFRNAGVSWLGTMLPYSNFELSFDVPYFLRQNLYDENDNQIASSTRTIAIGFGEEAPKPTIGNEYLKDVDLIDIGSTYVASRLAEKFAEDISDKGFFDVNSVSDGFSVKVSVIDGHLELQMKKLYGSNWTTVAVADYENFRTGYIYLWVTERGNFAIDNFKLENKDKEPNLIDVEYVTSVITAEDYVPTAEDTEMIFKEVVDDNNEKEDKFKGALCVTMASVVLVIALITVFVVVKRKKRKGGSQDEREKLV